MLHINHSPYLYLLPEITLLFMTVILLIIDLYLPPSKKYLSGFFAKLSLVFTISSLIYVYLNIEPHTQISLFNSQFVVDDLSQFLKLLIDFFGIVIFIYSNQFLKAHNYHQNEYFILILFSILGMHVLVSSQHFLTLYLGLELLSLPLYALVAFFKDDAYGSEASMKYFILGALASGLLLYGISLLYGLTQHFDFNAIAEAFAYFNTNSEKYLYLLGMMLVLVAFFFKWGGVPFHNWLPDVYQGAPTSVGLLISSIPKIAIFGMGVRLLNGTFQEVAFEREMIITVIAVLSLMVGNCLALVQTNIKRLLGYSTIGHMGFILLGFLNLTQEGTTASLHYLIIYMLMTLGAFGVLLAINQHNTIIHSIQDFKGLSRIHPKLSFIFLLILFALAGIPPTIGFYAKLFILQSLVNTQHFILAGIALFSSVIGAYYYLKIIKLMYFEDYENTRELSTVTCMSPAAYLILNINGWLMLILGVFPAFILNICSKLKI
ncbi:MAG: nuoN [Francisellaceae bacterium]|nr:nuoN [Francisellaceae bacterium]